MDQYGEKYQDDEFDKLFEENSKNGCIDFDDFVKIMMYQRN